MIAVLYKEKKNEEDRRAAKGWTRRNVKRQTQYADRWAVWCLANKGSPSVNSSCRIGTAQGQPRLGGRKLELNDKSKQTGEFWSGYL